MMKYSVAIENAISALNAIDGMDFDVDETMERLNALKAQLAKRSERSDEVKAKDAAKRKEKAHNERVALLAQVVPVLRKVCGSTQQGLTAKEIYSECADALPADFSAHKVQYILLHEMADEVDKFEKKGEANRYRMKIEG